VIVKESQQVHPVIDAAVEAKFVTVVETPTDGKLSSPASVDDRFRLD